MTGLVTLIIVLLTAGMAISLDGYDARHRLGCVGAASRQMVAERRAAESVMAP